MVLPNITVKEFLELHDPELIHQYEFFFKYSIVMNEAVDHFHIGDMTAKSFGLIKDLQFDISSGETGWIKLIEYVEKLINKKCIDLDLTTFVQTWKYILSEIERITEIESIVLKYEATDEEIQAGIDKLGILGIYMQIRSLTKGDITKNDEVRSMRYDEAFTELVAQKMLSDYEKELIKIMSKRNF
ncbi:MAG: hypothetical protein M0P71_11990 [Melioribacteraceae bacterium]|jgi:hypothetical protein|nr:hypothetical protein [Melioribacteraceae bacterium]